MKKRDLVAAGAILGLAFGGALTLAADAAADSVLMSAASDSESNAGPTSGSASDEPTANASGASFEQAAVETGNVNAASMSGAILSGGASAANAGTQFQQDTTLLIAGSAEDPAGTTQALTALTADQVNAMNVATAQQVKAGLSAASTRTAGARLASGVAAFRPGEALASQLLYGPGAGGAASADAKFGDMAVFLSVKYLNEEQDANDYTFGYDQDGWNFSFGADYQFRPNLVVGLMGSYGEDSVDYWQGRGDLEVDTWGLTAYGTYFWDSGAFLEGTLGFNQTGYDIKRRIDYGITVDGQRTDVNQTASASPDANVFLVSLGGGYSLARQSFTFTPQASLNYMSNDVDGYRESMSNPNAPGGSLGLAVDSKSYESLTSRLGFMLANAISTGGGVFVPQLSIDWVHEFSNDQALIGANFIGDRTATPFTIATTDPDRNYFDLGLGISGQFAQGRSAFISVNRLFGYDDLESYAVTGGFRMEF